MNKTLNTTLLVTLILVLTGGAFYAGTVYARSTNFGMWSMMGGYGRGGMMGNFNQGANSSYGPGGMMGGNGGMTLAPGASAGVKDERLLAVGCASSATGSSRLASK